MFKIITSILLSLFLVTPSFATEIPKKPSIVYSWFRLHLDQQTWIKPWKPMPIVIKIVNPDGTWECTFATGSVKGTTLYEIVGTAQWGGC